MRMHIHVIVEYWRYRTGQLRYCLLCRRRDDRGSVPMVRPLSPVSLTEYNLARCGIENEFARQIWREVFGDADRPHAWAAAAVRNAKGLVQIQMTNVAP